MNYKIFLIFGTEYDHLVLEWLLYIQLSISNLIKYFFIFFIS